MYTYFSFCNFQVNLEDLTRFVVDFCLTRFFFFCHMNYFIFYLACRVCCNLECLYVDIALFLVNATEILLINIIIIEGFTA